ncbi:unnamed protein product [Ectocarpus sp. CCAP 1310/34]|nr:unnamed protein product [Ectocarpus sp. CCAP 1310/34]
MFESGFANVFDDVAFAVPVMAPGKRPFSVGKPTKIIDVNLLHVSSSHANEFLLRELAKQHGLRLTGVLQPCGGCLQAKGKKAGVPHQLGTRAERPHDLWHIDLCGPMTASLGGSFFMIMFVDSFSRWMKLYGMRRKSDTLAFVKKFLADMSGTGVPRSFRMDNGGEFIGRDFIAFCDNAGIRRTYTAPGTPQQNGPAESAIWRVNKAGHAARLEAPRLFPKIDFTRVPGFGRDGERLWLESCHWAAGGFNRSPTKANVGYKSPHELFTGRPPPLQIVPFLQPGYMRVTRARKMDPQAVLCCYLNNGDNHHESAVKVLKFATGRVCMTNNVVWVSDRAPLLTPPLELPAPADEGGDSNVAAAPFLIEYISPPLLPPSPYARPPTSPAAILSQAPPATSTPPSPAAPPTAATPPPPVTAPPAPPFAAAPPFTITAPPAPPFAAAPPFTTTAPPATPLAPAPLFTTTAPPAPPFAAATPFTTAASPPASPFTTAAAPSVTPSPAAVPPGAAPSTNMPPLTTRTIRELDVGRADMRVSGRTRAAAKDQGGGRASSMPPLSARANRELGLGRETRVPGRLRGRRVRFQDGGAERSTSPGGSGDALAHRFGLVSLQDKATLLSTLTTRSIVDGGRKEIPSSAGGRDGAEPGGRERGGTKKEGLREEVPFACATLLASREDIDRAMMDLDPPEVAPDLPQCYASDLRVPKTYREAVSSQHADLWIHSVEKEFRGLMEADCGETYAPTVAVSSVRLLAAMACEQNLSLRHFDIKQAFVQSDLDEDVFMRLPEGCGRLSGMIVKLNKSLYGLKQASRQWHSHLARCLICLGFIQCMADTCVFRLIEEGRVVVTLVVHVDFIFSIGEEERCDQFGRDLNTMVPVKNLGDLRWYSGCLYERDWDAGTLKISQQTYAEELGMEFGVEYGKEIPLPVGLKLSEFDQDEEVVSWPFRGLIGSLMWLATQTRPDIANAVRAVERYCASPKEIHWRAGLGILGYVVRTSDLGITFRRGSVARLSMEVFADADCARKAADRRSVSGGLVMCVGGCISWFSRTQKCVTLSTTEAEYASLADVMKEVLVFGFILCVINQLGGVATFYIFAYGFSQWMMFQAGGQLLH